MKVSFGRFFGVLVICVLLVASVFAKPGNNWKPSDSRCGDGSSSGSSMISRLGRSVTSNGSGSGTSWRFNGNSGSCEQESGSADSSAFETEEQCNRACLNIYHFS